MKAYTLMQFDREDIQKHVPYAIIGETASRAVWDTGKRKRHFAEAFTEKERELCYYIIKKAKRWLLVTGCPESDKMRATTYALWLRLADFCATL